MACKTNLLQHSLHDVKLITANDDLLSLIKSPERLELRLDSGPGSITKW